MTNTPDSLEKRLAALKPRSLPDLEKVKIRQALYRPARDPKPAPAPFRMIVEILAMAASLLLLLGGYRVLSGQGIGFPNRTTLVARQNATPLSMLASNATLDVTLYPGLNKLVNNNVVAVITAPPFVTNGMAQL